MSRTPRHKRQGGFSLVELVIVVAIIAIIGAIAIPRMSRGAAGAADSALVADLAVLRNAVELYAAEHNGDFPDADAFEEQLTQFTNAAGDVSATKTEEYLFGPYVRSIPSLPVGSNSGEDGVADASTATLGAAGAGWYYNETTGEVQANLVEETDDAGREYSDY